jgi:catechol 2,3-dioxygenase-like lactoylglutathione lyase family enzyme
MIASGRGPERARRNGMINGAHVVVYADDAERARAFFRDVLGFPSVDAGAGWLIFALPPAEVGVHPAEAGGRHELYLMCDDVEATVAELRGKGAEFAGEIADQGFGIVATVVVPGLGEVGLYQPKHPVAHDGTAS